MSDEVLGAMRETGVILVIRTKRPDLIVPGVKAVLAAGVRCVEVTFTVKDAEKCIAQLNKEFGNDILLGAGSVLRPDQVDAAVEAGAKYIISPGFNAAVVSRSIELGAIACPGVFTPTEVTAAVLAGVRTLKLFPAGSAGIDHFKMLQGPFPGLNWIPTGGLGAKDLPAWFAAGALAIGAGSKLFPKELVEAEKWDELTMVAKSFMESVQNARKA